MSAPSAEVETPANEEHQAAHPESVAFAVDDLYRHCKVTEAHCLFDGTAAIAAVRSVDRDNDGYLSRVWMFPLDGTPPQQLTHGPGRDRSPRWSPRGDRIAFLSDRDEGITQVYVMDVATEQVRRCGTLPDGATAFRWSANGEHILVAAVVDANADHRGRTGGESAKQGKNAPEVAWRLPYKADGVGFLLSRQIHLFTLDVKSGVHRQLTHGAFDVLGFEGSPDDRQIAYVRTREGRFAHRTDLWICDRNGGNDRLVVDSLATITQPNWSPDGRHIAFSGAQAEGDGQSALYVYDTVEQHLRCLGDGSIEVAALPDAIHWSGNDILFARARRGCHEVARITPEGASPATVVATQEQFGTLACSSNEIVYSADHPAVASDLYASARSSGRPRRISDLNAWWRERTPIKAERRQFEVPDGRGGTEAIDGWIICARDARFPQPLLSDVHGGPASYALLDFDTNVFWQVLCSRGWTVLALNAVGSASYGREFCTRLNAHWGELDLPQHLAAIRQLQAEGIADERIAISGKSYGGFLSAWAIGHDDGFKAAVVMAPVGNIETHYGTCDGGYYADPLYLACGSLLDRQRARELSPLQYIEKSKTPTLFLQGKDDERCPKCQSEEMFVSLYCAGTAETELVLYPGEGHHFLGEGKPACRADAAARIVDWVTLYTE